MSPPSSHEILISATETWTLVNINTSGDNLTARAYPAAVVLENTSTGVSFIAVYGGYKSIGDGFLTTIQDFALFQIDTATWFNQGMAVNASFVTIIFSDYTCCKTCSIAQCPPARGDGTGKFPLLNCGT